MPSVRSGKIIKALIGQVHLTRAPNRLQAVLGSCVAVVVYDPAEHLAGMGHVLLPDGSGREKSSLPGKYADDAVACLLDALPKHGGVRKRLRAKIAGGAHMFGSAAPREDGDVGSLNVRAVREALSRAGVRIEAEDTGGDQGRKVDFDAESFSLTIEDFASGRRTI